MLTVLGARRNAHFDCSQAAHNSKAIPCVEMVLVVWVRRFVFIGLFLQVCFYRSVQPSDTPSASVCVRVTLAKTLPLDKWIETAWSVCT